MRSTLLVAFILLATAPAARADIESPAVKMGLAAYADLDYASAVNWLDKARHESLTREEKIATYQTLAMAHIALGQTAEAKTDFQHLLRVDPSFELDNSVAPKVRALFEQAKGEVATSGRGMKLALPAVTPTLTPATPQAGRSLTLGVTYPGGVAQKMDLYYRGAGQASFSRLTANGSPDSRFEAMIPGAQVQPPLLEFHIALLDEAGVPVAAAGSLGQPLSIAVAARKRPVYARAWFWGVIGGVAAAAAVAAGLAVGLPRSNTSTVTVNPQ
jgi:hypothetical protein